MEPTKARSGLGTADRIALIAFGGLLISFAAWTLFAYIQSEVMPQVTFSEAVFAPSPEQILARLVTIVFILLATLVTQALYAKRERSEERLALERARVVQLYENSPDGILCLDLDRRITFVSPSATSMMPEQASDDLIGRQCFRAIWGRDVPCEGCQALEVLRTKHARDRTIHDSSFGLERWLEKVIYPVLDDRGAVESLVEVTRDTTARILALQTIEHMAFHDALTGLPNRALFRDRLAGAIASAQRRGDSLAVAFLDLDDFKTINDTLGHGVGDGVLKAVARRLAELVRDEDTVARQSGDEFTILARVAGVEDAGPLADRIFECLSDPISVEGHDLHVSASIGMAVYPRDGATDHDLLRNADTAMYCAKEWGHNVYRLYDAEMGVSAHDRLTLETALRLAISRNEFVLFYQPQVDIVKQRIVGLEALLRWNHPTQGVIGPGDFIEVAERAGLMSEIGEWVIRTACGQASAWLAQGLDIGRVAVNMSTREFIRDDIVEHIGRALAEADLEPSRLEIEITEATAMHDVDHVLKVLIALRTLGVRAAIDDFGTGYSSMSSLKRFPFNTLKIGEEFMVDIHIDPHSSAIAVMLIDLCRELRIHVVAEGVENDAQLGFLVENKCAVIQGNIFSRPLPASRIADLFARGFEQFA